MEDLFKLCHDLDILDELAEKLKPFSYRVLKEDCLDLPEKTFMKRQIELSEEQKESL